MTVTLATPLSAIISNKRRTGGLKALGVATCGDALTYYPRRLAKAAPLTPLDHVRRDLKEILLKAAAAQNEKKDKRKPDIKPVTFPATVRNVYVSPMSGTGSRIEVTVDDADYIMNPKLKPGRATLTFFTYNRGYVDWMMGRVRVGALLAVKGKPSFYGDVLQFIHPELLVAGVDCRDVTDGVNRMRLPRPVYHANARITTDRIHESIATVLDAFEGRMPTLTAGLPSSAGAGGGASAGAAGSGVPGVSTLLEPVAGVTTLAEVPDIIPEAIRTGEGLMHRAEAFEAVHRPNGEKRFFMGLRTLRFEEALVSQIALLRARADAQRTPAFPCAGGAGAAEAAGAAGVARAAETGMAGAAARSRPPTSMTERFIDSLPFTLTGGQREVIDTIGADMARDVPMQRLLEGEVGSGKTVVALASMLRAVDSGYQTVLVAPTQVLAEQHLESVSAMLRRAGLLDEDWEVRYGGKSRRKASDGGAGEDRAGAGGVGVAVVGSGASDAGVNHAVASGMGDAARDAVGAGHPNTMIDAAADYAAVNHANAAHTDAADGAHANVREDRGTKPYDGPRVPVVLLVGGMRLAQRRRALALAASGDPCIVIATHAAFSGTFQMPRMALAVIDEQHRFGVEQRDALRRKSEQAPHLLVMTATPIPRTAAMTWFGDLDLSELTELPGGRKPISTSVVSEQDGHAMGEMFGRLRQRIDAGERVFVVCPAIEEPDADAGAGAARGTRGRNAAAGRRRSTRGDAADLTDGADLFDLSALDDGDDGSGSGSGAGSGSGSGDGEDAVPALHSVREIAGRLAALPQLAGVEIATLTGRDTEEDKRETMERFSSGDAPLLVSTTVIEVGVDVPQASCIVIFDADRFGLSQLHQLRGRVGRGGTDAWCFLVSRAIDGPIKGAIHEDDSLIVKRLKTIRDNTNGARIAEEDVELRGAGDVLGDVQSGNRSSFKLLRVVGDKEIIVSARRRAQELLATNPALAGEPQLAGAALDFMRGNEDFLNRS